MKMGIRIVFTDNSWKSSRPYTGKWNILREKYDARLEMPGWSTYHFDDTNWEETEIVSGPDLRYQDMPPIRVTRA